MQGGLGVVQKGKEVFLFYRLSSKQDNSIYIAKSANGYSFKTTKQKAAIINQTGKPENIGNCSDFFFSRNENNEFVLSYKLLRGKKHYYHEAVSKTLFRWKVKKTSSITPEPEIIVPGYSSNAQKVKYSGRGSFYINFLKTISKKKGAWEKHPLPVLAPRIGRFDDSDLHIAAVFAVKKGILLSYFIKYERNERHRYAGGMALFDKKNPSKLVWRSPDPVWEDPEDWEEKRLSFLGSARIKKNLFLYWEAKNGEIFSIEWPYEEYLADLNKSKLIVHKLSRFGGNPIITPRPENLWESKATMNAAAIYENGRVHLLYRAIGETDISVIGYASSPDGLNFDKRSDTPIYVPREKFEGAAKNSYNYGLSPYISGGGGAGGCEDPRLTKIDNTLYMTYMAFDGYHGPRVAITSIKLKDFLNKQWKWEKPKILSRPGQTHKNWVLFPEKINGKYAILHSIAPHIAIDYVDSLDIEDFNIESRRLTHGDENSWDNIVRGAGAPPIKTKYGWLLFYHAMDKRDPDRYKIGAMILDYKNPKKILYRARLPVLEPDEKYENEGFKSGVVYACGATLIDDDLFVYYGGADTVTCVAMANLNEFLNRMVGKTKVKTRTINFLNN